jgi:hypothetical protein
MPLIGLGLVVDHLIDPLVPALGASNAYRLLARLDGRGRRSLDVRRRWDSGSWAPRSHRRATPL